MIRASTTAAGLQRLATKFSNRANFLGREGMKAILERAGEELVKAYKTRIATFTPGPVQDLKEATKKRKLKSVGRVYPILVEHGDMIRSMAVTVNLSRAKGWVVALVFKGHNRKGRRNEDVARAHLEGSGRLPVRDFAVVPKEWQGQLFASIRKGLNNV